MDALGYHVVNWDLDTDDYNNNAPDRIWVSRQQFLDAMAQYRNSYLPIAHDPSYQTVANLVEFMIDSAVARGYRSKSHLGDGKRW